MTNHRSAITGQYVTAEHAKTNPDTTVSESQTRRPAGDYSDLRARAEACPPEDDFNSIWYSEDRLEVAIGTKDRPFVAACSPTVVLGLLDELDRLSALVEAVREDARDIARDSGDDKGCYGVDFWAGMCKAAARIDGRIRHALDVGAES